MVPQDVEYTYPKKRLIDWNGTNNEQIIKKRVAVEKKMPEERSWGEILENSFDGSSSNAETENIGSNTSQRNEIACA